MKIKQYLNSWRGVDFSDLQIDLPLGAPADKNFYNAFYRALGERDSDQNSQWHSSKRALGRWIAEHILRPLANPRILSIGVGEALPETLWLRHGYDVTLNECQDNTLAAVKAQFPAAPIMIADAFDLRPTGSYDAVTVLTVDYALTDRQLADTFANMARALTPSGILINYSVNILTAKQLGKEILKKALARHKRRGSVLWGWSRTPGAIVKIAAAAGLELKAQYAADGDTFVARKQWLRRVPPLQNPIMLMTFARCGNQL